MVLLSDCDVIKVDSDHVLSVPFQVFINLFKLLLELADVITRMRVQLLQLKLGPSQSFLLVLVPSVRGLKLHLRLNDVELFSEFVELFVMNLQS